MGTAAGRESVLIRRDASKGELFRAHICLLVFGWLILSAATSHSQDLGQLAASLRAGNTEERRTVLMQLRSLRSEVASRLAATALHDKVPMVRAMAASAVLFLPRTEAVQDLLPLLNDKDEFVRREIASALGDVGDMSAAGPLIKILKADKSSEVQTAAAIALGKVGEPDAVTYLLQVLSGKPTEANEMLRRAAVRSIGQIAQIMRSGRAQVVTPQNFLPVKFKDIDAKPSPDLITHFAKAEKRLIQILDSPGEADDTRRETAFALGAIGDPSAETVLRKYASTEDPYLTEIVKEALLKLSVGN